LRTSKESYFARKLTIVESFNLIDSDTLLLIREFNKIRNQCAHKLEYRVTQENIENLGSCIPEIFKEFQNSENVLLDMLSSVLIDLAFNCYKVVKAKKQNS